MIWCKSVERRHINLIDDKWTAHKLKANCTWKVYLLLCLYEGTIDVYFLIFYLVLYVFVVRSNQIKQGNVRVRQSKNLGSFKEQTSWIGRILQPNQMVQQTLVFDSQHYFNTQHPDFLTHFLCFKVPSWNVIAIHGLIHRINPKIKY